MDEGNNNALDNGNSGEGENPSWMYQAATEDNAGIPGSGDTPDWFRADKYGSVEDQAKAYPELAKRFGGFEAAPEGDYVMPENFNGQFVDQALIDIVGELGKENNMSQTMFNQMIGKIDEFYTQHDEQNIAAQMEALGENAEQRIQDVNDWLNANAPEELLGFITDNAQNAQVVEALEFFIGKSKGTPLANNHVEQPTGITQSEYAVMLSEKDANGNLKISTDKAYKQKMEKLAAELA